MQTTATTVDYSERIAQLRETKLRQTQEKQDVLGSMDHDDWGMILPPEDNRTIVDTISGSGMPIKDSLLASFKMEGNHPSGGAFGPVAMGTNFGRLLRVHPVYLDPMSSLAGGYMVNFNSYRKPRWNPDFDYPELRALHEKYDLVPGIGAAQHFCQDLSIGFELGWGGILEKIERYRSQAAADKHGFYDGLTAIVHGAQDWIARHARAAGQMADTEDDPALAANLREIALINEKLVTGPPQTFREAAQWILWFDLMARMYNGSGSLGKIDVLLEPYYRRDLERGVLTDDEAVYHLACLFLRDAAYMQVGGPDAGTDDATNQVSYLALEAAHELRIPVNLGVAVGKTTDPGLLERGVRIMLEDKTGIPKFLGVDRTIEGFMRNGYSEGDARLRAYSGCHWSAIPGREYTMNDCVKINFAKVFEVAFAEMMHDPDSRPSVDELWERFAAHLETAVDAIVRSVDFHRAHQHEIGPELVIDLLCHGTIEQGLDASCGGVEFTNVGVDGSALATVADSFGAIEQRVETEGKLTWRELAELLENDWAGPEGEAARLMMKNTPRYGQGGTAGDAYADRISAEFTRLVRRGPTPGGATLIPGLFSWANTIPMGKAVGATPNGRHAGAPISHGANPDPGFAEYGAPTLMATAIARVQPGYGNAAPMQMELDFPPADRELAVHAVSGIIKTHFELGGTQINLNLIDRERILEAHEDPSKYPDLVVRVTGFSAYFASLSPRFRQLVVDRIIAAE
jgi:formate C-acetyltransferase